MRTVSRSALVPHSAQRMFDLVDDVQSYPAFVPWCVGSEVHSVDGDVMDCSLDVSRGLFQGRFRTRNTRIPGQSIHLDLVDGPFRVLDGEWRFVAMGEEGCRIELELRFEIASRILRAALEPLFEEMVGSLMDAFIRRAADETGVEP